MGVNDVLTLEQFPRVAGNQGDVSVTTYTDIFAKAGHIGSIRRHPTRAADDIAKIRVVDQILALAEGLGLSENGFGDVGTCQIREYFQDSAPPVSHKPSKR